LHPNALGEYQLAQAFSHTLIASFCLGRSELAIPCPIPSRPLPTPQNVVATPSPGRVTVTWQAVYGAYGYDVEHRVAVNDHDNDSAGWTPTHVEGNALYVDRLLRRETVQCRVRTSGGDGVYSPWSSVVSATAEPLAAPAPRGIVTHATARGFVVSWEPLPEEAVPPEQLDRFGVIYFDGDAAGFQTFVGVRGTQAEFGGLVQGHRYFVAVETWTRGGVGMPAAARAVKVGGGRPPAAPVAVRVWARDGHTVEVAWPEVEGAAAYEVWLREVRRGWHRRAEGQRTGRGSRRVQVDGLSSSSPSSSDPATISTTISDLEPSVWDWEFAVRAYNGDDASGLSEWVIAPRPAAEDVSLAEDDAIHVALRHG
jgi:hypothetical protein